MLENMLYYIYDKRCGYTTQMNKHEQPLFISHAPTVKRYFTGLCCDENI